MRFLILGFALFLTSCSRSFVKEENPHHVAVHLEKIAAYNQVVSQLKASLDIRAYGMLRSVIHERADIVVSSPHSLFLSLRSFFGPPTLMFASNGKAMTMRDFSGQSPSFHNAPLKPDSFFELLDFRFHPQSIIDIILAKIPLDGARDIRVTTQKDKIEINADLPHGWSITAIFDEAMNRLLKNRLFNRDLAVSYEANYTNFALSGDIAFPRSMMLIAKAKSRFLRLNVDFLQIELNGAAVLPEVFNLAPH